MKFELPNAKEFSRKVATEEQLLYIQYLLELKIKLEYKSSNSVVILQTTTTNGKHNYVRELRLPLSSDIKNIDIESDKISYLYCQRHRFNESLMKNVIFVDLLVDKLNSDLSALGYTVRCRKSGTYNFGEIVLSW